MKMKTRTIKFLIIIIINISLLKNVSSKLLFVAEHFRHGSRTPTRFFDSLDRDHFYNKWNIKGELTPIGMRMHYILGYKTKIKYKNFLPDYFDHRQFYLYTSDYNRTIESLLCQLNGLYPPGNGLPLNERQRQVSYPPNQIDSSIRTEIEDSLKNFSLPFQMNSFPFHIFHENQKIFLLDDTRLCKGITNLKKDILSSNMFNDLLTRFYNQFGEELTKAGNNITKESLSDIRYVFHMCDDFVVDFIEDKDLSFLEKTGINLNNLYNSCKDISMEYLEKVYLGGGKNGEIAAMSISRLMKKVILHFMKIRADLAIQKKSDHIDYSSPKFALISGHDNTVLANEMLLNQAFYSELIYPSYASNLFFELHQKENVEDPTSYKDFYVLCLMNDRLILKENFDYFLKKLEEVMWTDEKIDHFCGFVQEKKVNVYKVLTFFFGSTSFALMAFLVFYVYRNHKRSKSYQKINMYDTQKTGKF